MTARSWSGNSLSEDVVGPSPTARQTRAVYLNQLVEPRSTPRDGTPSGARHGLQLTERGSRLIGRGPFTRLTQVPKGARDGAIPEAHSEGGRIAPLCRGGRQKLGREALRPPRPRLGDQAHRDRRRSPRNPRSPHGENARPDPRPAGCRLGPAHPTVPPLPGMSATAAL